MSPLAIARTGEPRFGREKVVAIGIQRGFRDEIAYRQQFPVVVEQKAEFHRHRHGPERLLQGDQPGMARHAISFDGATSSRWASIVARLACDQYSKSDPRRRRARAGSPARYREGPPPLPRVRTIALRVAFRAWRRHQGLGHAGEQLQSRQVYSRRRLRPRTSAPRDRCPGPHRGNFAARTKGENHEQSLFNQTDRRMPHRQPAGAGANAGQQQNQPSSQSSSHQAMSATRPFARN